MYLLRYAMRFIYCVYMTLSNVLMQCFDYLSVCKNEINSLMMLLKAYPNLRLAWLLFL